MTGNNEIVLCTPQLIEIVQRYFDDHLFKEGQSPKVLDISVAQYGGGDWTVKTEEKEAVTP